MRKWIAAAIAAAGLCFASSAPAQLTTTPAYATLEYETWTFAPIVSNNVIKGFFAHADPATLTGENIPMILYHREADGTFTTWGWSEYDLGDAVLYIRDAYDDDKIFEIDPVLSTAVGPTSDIEQPKNMADGLYFDDPARLMLELAPDPAQLMTTLVSIGWKAAPVLSVLAVLDEPDEAPACPALPVEPVDQLLTIIKFRLDTAILGAPAIPADCFPPPECTGCITNYAPPVPDAGAGWRYCCSGTPRIVNRKLCFYDWPGTQYWWKSGKDLDCSVCSGSGTSSYTFRATTVVMPGQACTLPTRTP